MTSNGNGTGMWVRWALGFLILGVLTLAGVAATNAVGVARNETSITGMEESLKRIERKVDRLLESRGLAAESAGQPKGESP